MDDVSRIADLTHQLTRALEDNLVLYSERDLLMDELSLLQEEIRELKQRLGLQEPLLHD